MRIIINFLVTIKAFIMGAIINHFRLDIMPFLLFAEAVCTKQVKWLSCFICFFVSIHRNTRSEFFQLILTLYLRPFFKLRYFLYKCIFLSQQKRMFLLHQQSIVLYGEEYLKDFGNSLVSFNLSIEGAYALCDIIRNFSRGKN